MKDAICELISQVKRVTQQQEDILFEQRETLFKRTPYAFERHILQLIRQGEPDTLSMILAAYRNAGCSVGNLSSNALLQA